MSAGHQGNPQNNSTWTEPPWSGWIETTGDALLILEAARRGLIPRVTRRLVDSERKMITSGSVFVFDEDESGIKRWTDGFFWSPSRILGNFLLYRETDKRGSGHRSVKDNDIVEFDNKGDTHSLSRPKTDPGQPGVDKTRERTLVGSLTNTYKFKPEGLMKKTFSLTIGGVAQHLISYYKIEDVESGRLRPPSSLPELASLEISPEYLDKAHFRHAPKVEMCADGVLRYRGEADDIDTSVNLLTGPLTGMPLITDGRVGGNINNKRPKYEPYAPPPKRPRRTTKSVPPADLQQAQLQSQPQDEEGNIVMSPTSPQPQPQTYSEPNITPASPTPAVAPVTPYPAFGAAPYYQVHGYVQHPPHIPVYPGQTPYGAMSPTQYAGYPHPMHPGQPIVAPVPAQIPTPTSAPVPTPSIPTHPPATVPTPVGPFSPSHVSQVSSTSMPTPQAHVPVPVQGYYHPPPPHPYYPPPAPSHHQVYTAYPAPPPTHPTVWHPHPQTHAYAGYAPSPQQYSYYHPQPPPAPVQYSPQYGQKHNQNQPPAQVQHHGQVRPGSSEEPKDATTMDKNTEDGE